MYTWHSRSPCLQSKWNRILEKTRDDFIEFAVDYEALATCELAIIYTDENRTLSLNHPHIVF